MKKYYLFFVRIIFIVLVLCTENVFSQTDKNYDSEDKIHELTVYVIRSVLPLNWDSPSTLYKSYKKEIGAKIFRKQKSMLGHTFVMLRSPLLKDSIFTGMTYVSKKNQRKLFMKDKIGMGILGIYMEGRMQPHEELTKKMNYYASKDEVSFIRYNISEEAAKRIISFYNSFTTKFDDEHAKCDFYGGAFWPRYGHEGSGCSAFGFSILELAQILEDCPEWKKSVDIPMDLIGGEINNNRKVKISDIKNAKSWHIGNNKSQKDYVSFEVYDPSSVFYWIRNQRNLPDSLVINGYAATEYNGIPGLFADRSKNVIDKNESVLLQRENSNIFIDYFYRKTGLIKPE